MFGMSKPKPKPAKRSAAPSATGESALPQAQDKASAVAVTLELTPAQVNKLALLGGATWVGKQIDKAKAKAPPAASGSSATR